MDLSSSLLVCRGVEVCALQSILACAKTTIPMGGIQIMTDSSKDAKSGPVLGEVKLLWRETLDPCWPYQNFCRSALQSKGFFLSFLQSLPIGLKPAMGVWRHSQLLRTTPPETFPHSKSLPYLISSWHLLSEQLDKHNYILGCLRNWRESFCLWLWSWDWRMGTTTGIRGCGGTCKLLYTTVSPSE